MAKTIAEIKKEYPVYKNIPDVELADKIYDKYYLSNNKMCKKQTSFINEKQIAKGVDKIPYMKKEL